MYRHSDLMQKINQYLFCTALIFLILINQCDVVLGNPLPFRVDENYGGFPVPANYDCAKINCSVFFKQEIIKVTFNSSKANINALYSFKNNDSTSINMSIILPLPTYGKELNVSLLLEENEIAYRWLDSRELRVVPILSGSLIFRAIAFNMSFTADEEKTIHVQYSRDYHIVDRWDKWGKKTHYDYSYLVGTARAWNRSLESAYFEFWVPKNLSKNIPQSNENMSVRDKFNYFVLSVEYKNWLPSTGDEVIGVAWHKTIEDWTWINILLLGSVPVLSAIIAILVIIIRKAESQHLILYYPLPPLLILLAITSLFSLLFLISA